MYNTKNYTEQGGDKTVIGGEIEFSAAAVVSGLAATPTKAGIVKQTANITALSGSATLAQTVTAYNLLLTGMTSAGIMAGE